ncbi:hypothetical protein LIER_27148 [Lithospermum erythrorhizon]|uniref:Pectinesterase inhibitor domain-containing protein n=1 Tax=Lithospermum erythrorhizon TaxID=34254 RepID=A0AAV3RCM0_LITER
MKIFCLHFLLVLFISINQAFISESTQPSNTNFIKSSCKVTRYPALCIHCLSIYANKIQENELQLAQAALEVSLSKAKSTTMFVYKLAKAKGMKPRTSQAVKDCMDTMSDSMDQISKSIKEMSRVRRGGSGQDFMWHMSNVETWVSAALTDENTCLDGFSGGFVFGKVKVAVRRRIVYVAQVTSNALALVNRFAARHPH